MQNIAESDQEYEILSKEDLKVQSDKKLPPRNKGPILNSIKAGGFPRKQNPTSFEIEDIKRNMYEVEDQKLN